MQAATSTRVKLTNQSVKYPRKKFSQRVNWVHAANFTGNAYNIGLVANDSTYNTLVGNVYFEKNARSNWHVHPSGQILIVLDGEGYHQLEGQPRQTMRKGDVIKCPPKVKHWHGATENSSLTQLYIFPKTENGIVTWLEPVTDDQYKSKN